MSIFKEINEATDTEIVAEALKGIMVVNKDTIVVDGRGKSRAAIRKIANKHFFGSESGTERDPGDKHGEGGYLMLGNQVHYANVASVQDGIIVASKKDLGAKETRPLAKKFVDSLNESEDDVIVGGMGKTANLKTMMIESLQFFVDQQDKAFVVMNAKGDIHDAYDSEKEAQDIADDLNIKYN